MKNSKKIVFLALLLATPLVQAIAHRTGITSHNTTRVRFVNNTNRTLIVKNIKCNQQKIKGGALGYKLGEKKEKTFSNKTIKPGKTESVFLVDRDFPIGAFAGTLQHRDMPYEEWVMDVVDQNAPNCQFAIIVRASRGNMPPSGIGLSFKAAKEMYGGIKDMEAFDRHSYHYKPLWKKALEKTVDTLVLKGVTGALVIPTVTGAILASTPLIDTVAQGVGQFVGSIGVNTFQTEPTCVKVSEKFKWQGGLYKNLYITINPK